MRAASPEEAASRTLSVAGRAELEGYAAGAGEHG